MRVEGSGFKMIDAPKVITALSGIDVKPKESLSNYTFTKTGGKADFVVFPKNVDEVAKVVAFTKDNAMPLTVIGNASNLIVRDGGIPGMVMILTQMKKIKHNGNCIIADAGARIIDTSEAAYQASLTGLEFAAGIPGSVGGAVFMNAGAYGGDVSDVITDIIAMDRDGNIHQIHGSELHFGYRHSVVQEENLIVLSATFTLKPGDASAIRKQMDYLNYLRASKQPLEYPSCGSVYKRPVGHYTGPLIQQAGLQGKIIGGAQVSTKHAGFIVNINHATATDYLDLIHLIQRTIYAKFAVRLETEVRIIGVDPNDPRAVN